MGLATRAPAESGRTLEEMHADRHIVVEVEASRSRD